MALEIEGRIVRKLNVQSGTSSRGPWEKQEFIVEYQEGNFPTQICMNVWGSEKVKDLGRFQVGDKVKISFNLSSREFQGRWYTDVRAWRIESADNRQYDAQPQYGQAPQTGTPSQYGAGNSYGAVQQAPAPGADDFSESISEDDLPF
ncbi:MAG: DUF3127 domain-containing protein [Candidatus Cryptobacteroides sp.]